MAQLIYNIYTCMCKNMDICSKETKHLLTLILKSVCRLAKSWVITVYRTETKKANALDESLVNQGSQVQF